VLWEEIRLKSRIAGGECVNTSRILMRVTWRGKADFLTHPLNFRIMKIRNFKNVGLNLIFNKKGFQKSLSLFA
jgi:hypothetical protein